MIINTIASSFIFNLIFDVFCAIGVLIIINFIRLFYISYKYKKLQSDKFVYIRNIYYSIFFILSVIYDIAHKNYYILIFISIIFIALILLYIFSYIYRKKLKKELEETI